MSGGKVSISEFVQRANEIHHNKYDYSKVYFTKLSDSVTIICPEHGEFQQTAKLHLTGRGCKQCGVEKRISESRSSKDEFIEKAKQVHGEKYDYTKVTYINSITPVTIICPEHGEFTQQPNLHLTGRGCQKCGYIIRGNKKRSSKDEFIEKAKQVHGEKYDYTKVTYINSITPVTIICPEHGEFTQQPNLHLTGRGCQKCGLLQQANTLHITKDNFLKRALEVHGEKYDYTKVAFNNVSDNVTIICPEHGLFIQTITSHLSGHGCVKCARLQIAQKQRKLFSVFVEQANKVHDNKYTYVEASYVCNSDYVTIICPEHGLFMQKGNNHLAGKGCPECGKITAKNAARSNTNEFVEKALKLYDDKYDYSKVNYQNALTPVTIICPEHGEFLQTPDRFLQGYGCQRCGYKYMERSNTGKSKIEIEILEFVKSLIPDMEIQQSNFTVLENVELDIYIPELKIAIEMDGLYWHSEKFKSTYYHLSKTNKCEKLGIQLIHVFEDEWNDKQEIVKSRLRNILHKTDNRLYARKCVIRKLSLTEEKTFLVSNHLQGYTPSKVCYGLICNNEIVSLMSFGGLRKSTGNTPKENQYELLRFCNKNNTSVVGAASKLFKLFVKEYNPSYIISYADRRYSQGNLYKQLGMYLSGITQPNYFYVIGNKRHHRFNFRKDILISKYGCPSEMTEHEFCLSQNWLRIYDCGSIRFEMYFV